MHDENETVCFARKTLMRKAVFILKNLIETRRYFKTQCFVQRNVDLISFDAASFPLTPPAQSHLHHLQALRML